MQGPRASASRNGAEVMSDLTDDFHMCQDATVAHTPWIQEGDKYRRNEVQRMAEVLGNYFHNVRFILE
jgi:hypothetical protein